MTDARVDEMVKRLREKADSASWNTSVPGIYGAVMRDAASLLESLAESAERVRELEAQLKDADGTIKTLNEMLADPHKSINEAIALWHAAERKLAEAQGVLLTISGAESTEEALDIFRREREANVGLAAENERLREGLQWYADGNHFDLPDWDEYDGWLCPPNDSPWIVDPGNCARCILNGQRINPDPDADQITIDAALSGAAPEEKKQ